MKKTALIAASLLFLQALAFSSLQAQQNPAAGRVIQIFMPKTVYVGDTAELRYIFQTEADLFGDRAVSRIQLTADYPALRTTANDRSQRCYIKDAVIDRNGTEYTLVITLIPWKSGEIDFMPFDLAQWIRFSREETQYGASYDVDFKPVTVRSLAESLHASSLRPTSAPLIIPGTTPLLVLIGTVCLLLFSALIVLLIRLGSLTAFLRTHGTARYLHKQAKIALKKLRQLQKEDARKKLDDKSYCAAVQHILRAYLSKRFGRDFSTLPTPALEAACRAQLGGDLDGTEEKAVADLTELFMRSDYIRYSNRGALTAESNRSALLAAATACIQSFDNRQGESEA